MFARKPKWNDNSRLENDSPGVFTITESFEFGKSRSAFYPSIASSTSTSTSTSSTSSPISTLSIGSVKRARNRRAKRPPSSSSSSSQSTWRSKYIADWKNILTVRNILRLIAWSFCVFYCLKYALHIYVQFGNYETIVTLEYRSQRSTLVPAISLCSHCILCTLNEHRLRSLPIHKILVEPDTWHWVRYEKQHAPSEDIAVDCRISRMFQEHPINCADVVKPVVSLQEGHKCLTFFSNMNAQINLLNDSMRELITMDFNYSPRITLLINGTFVEGHLTGNAFQNMSRLNMTDPKRAAFRRTGVYIKLHERNLLTDMKDLNYHQVRHGVRTDIFFTKKSVTLMPKPYKTNCHNYTFFGPNQTTPPWKLEPEIILGTGRLEVGGLYLYRTRGECIIYCLWRLLRTNNCVNFFSIIDQELHKAETLLKQDHWMRDRFNPKNNDNMDVETMMNYQHTNLSMWAMRFCLNSESQYIEYVNAKSLCVSYCLEDCHNEFFYEDDSYETLSDNRAGNWRNHTQIDIDWATGPVTNVYHNERMDLHEFFGQYSSLFCLLHLYLSNELICIILISFQELSAVTSTSGWESQCH